jgi:4-diphosphocytidyl-2-C-methyl-D-erythritol kinase
MEGRTTFRAYAKVNLCLSVGAPIPQGQSAGFHPIASWMQAVDLYDEIAIGPALDADAGSSYSIRWADDAPRPTPIDWPIDKDLAARAHRAFESAVRALGAQIHPVHIEVIKRIPVGSGMGGGSSDAAAALLALLQHFERTMSDEDLRRIAMSLGSDVAFFADQENREGVPRAALVNGLGDQIRRVQSVPGELVLVVPPYICPTGPVYKAFDEILKERQAQDAAERAARGITGREKQTGPRESLVESRWKRMASRESVEGDHLFNDLALAAFRVEPRLGRLVTALSNATREQAHVTGSGSCVFIPSTSERIGRLRERIDKLLSGSDEFAGVKVVTSRLL